MRVSGWAFQDLGNIGPKVDSIWVMWGSYYNEPKAIFYPLQGDDTP